MRWTVPRLAAMWVCGTVTAATLFEIGHDYAGIGAALLTCLFVVLAERQIPSEVTPEPPPVRWSPFPCHSFTAAPSNTYQCESCGWSATAHLHFHDPLD